MKKIILTALISASIMLSACSGAINQSDTTNYSLARSSEQVEIGSGDSVSQDKQQESIPNKTSGANLPAGESAKSKSNTQPVHKKPTGDLTIKNGYKLNLSGLTINPAVIGGKVLSLKKTSDEGRVLYVSDQAWDKRKTIYGEYELGLTDPVSGEYTKLFSDMMFDTSASYSVEPDDKSVILYYYGKTNLPKDNKDEYWYDDIYKDRTCYIIDIDTKKATKLDKLKDVVFYNLVGDNAIGISRTLVNVSQDDYNGRELDGVGELPATAYNTSYDVVNLSTGKVTNLGTNYLSDYAIKKGEQRIFDICFYSDLLIINHETCDNNGDLKYVMEVYDQNLNKVYEDNILNKINGQYQDMGYYGTGISVCQGEIYMHCGGADKARFYKYTPSADGYTKQEIFPEPAKNDDDMIFYYSYSGNQYNEIDYSIQQNLDDGDGLSKLVLTNPCISSKVTLLVKLKDYKVPELMQYNTCFETTGRGDTIVAGEGSDRDNTLHYWYIPKEEMERALYGD